MSNVQRVTTVTVDPATGQPLSVARGHHTQGDLGTPYASPGQPGTT
jgi:hypothetical protein